MEFEEKEEQKLDLFVLLDDFLRQAKRMWLLLLVLVLLFSVGMTAMSYRSYTPVYEAHASFLVHVANPLYSDISAYNTKTAEVMASTFPSIVSTGVLQKEVREYLGISRMPSISVSASAASSILTLRVRDTDPQLAYDVLNAVIECYPSVAEFVVGSTELVLLDESGVPAQPVAEYEFRSSVIKGIVAGAGLWCVIVLFLILVKNTVHNEDELRRTLNTPCLGQLPAIKIPRRLPCPLVHKTGKIQGFGESIRLLRLRVEKAMEEEDKKILLVSSAIPGEGKTTVSVNLAVSLAQKGKKVLLIDCDLRNPSVLKALNSKAKPLSNKVSLVEYIKGSATVMEMIQPTEVNNLFVISGGAGTKSGYSTRLSQDRMARLIQASRNLYDYVILDTPPCSLLADAAEVAELAECGLMVIRQDFAARDQILDGIQRLSDGKLPIIGCALNNVRRSITAGYGYGYGYSYGYGYGYGSKK